MNWLADPAGNAFGANGQRRNVAPVCSIVRRKRDKAVVSTRQAAGRVVRRRTYR